MRVRSFSFGRVPAFSLSAVQRMGRAARRHGLDLLLPPTCAYCAGDLPTTDAAQQLCRTCRAGFLNLREPVCPRCAVELPPLAPPDASSCAGCRDHKFYFSSTWAMGAYRGEVREAMLQIKHAGGYPLAAALGRLLLDRCRAHLTEFAADVVVPIPLHWMRRMRRGASSAEAVAESLAAGLNVPFAPRLLVRRKRTERQADLPPGSRFQNVRGVFGVGAGYDVKGLKVLVVDDILTTGATCSEAARTLLSAGVAQVAVAVTARAAPWK